MKPTTFTFDTTHHALWAEELAKELDIPHEIVAAPPGANARCSIAVQILPVNVDVFSRVLKENGVTSRIHNPAALEH